MDCNLWGFDHARPFHAYCLVGPTQCWREGIRTLITSFTVGIADQRLFLDAPSISVGDIRMIERFVRQTPAQGNRKLIAFNGHGLTQEAAHAFLKTLEEPSGHTMIILCVEMLSVLLPTITSRCQIVRLTPRLSTTSELGSQDFLGPPILECQGWPLLKRLNFIETYLKAHPSGQETLALLDFWLKNLYDTNNHLKEPFLVEVILRAKKQRLANVQARLVLEDLMMHL